MDQREVFKRFMNERFLAYQNTKGTRATVTEFADAISKRAESGEMIYQFYQGDVSHWLKGNRIPGATMLKMLAQSPLIGSGVWQAAGFEIPGEQLDPLEEMTIAAMRRIKDPVIREQFARMVEREAKKAQTGQEGGARQYSFQTA